MQSDHPMVLIVSGSDNQTRRVGAVDEPDCAVVEQEQVVGHLSNGRTTRIVVPPYSQEKLVLGGCQTSRLCLLLAPAFEMAQPRS